jgi:hypothetical protein
MSASAAKTLIFRSVNALLRLTRNSHLPEPCNVAFARCEWNRDHTLIPATRSSAEARVVYS